MAKSLLRLRVMAFFIGMAFVQSQTLAQKVLVQGQIVYNGKGVEGIHLVSKTTNYSAVSGGQGNFEIQSTLNDTLQVYGVQFKATEYIIREKDIENEAVSIQLTKRVNELNEVFVSRTGLTGFLEKDLNSIPYSVLDPSKKLGIPIYEGEPTERIPSVFETFGYGIPTQIQIEPLYKHLSGYYKRLKNKRAFEANDKLAERLLLLFSSQFFEDAYSLENKEVLAFLYFCIETEEAIPKYLENENFAALISLFNYKLDAYDSK